MDVMFAGVGFTYPEDSTFEARGYAPPPFPTSFPRFFA
jgi:hypothetical protein